MLTLTHDPFRTRTRLRALPRRAPDPTHLLFVPVGRDRSPCDLLHELPLERIDLAAASEALTFAFASGDGDVFTRLLEHTPVADSSFSLDEFGSDLQLTQFVARCMPVVAGGRKLELRSSYVLRVLAAPPRDRAHVEFRQRVCAELASSAQLEERLQHLYSALIAFRDRLSRPSVGVRDGIERRLGILGALRVVIDALADDFAGTTSGLERLHHFGQELRRGSGYRRLCELLDYERNRTQVDVRLNIGFDGRIRAFQLLERRDDRRNAFYETALGRLWTQLLLILCGYRGTTGEILSRLIDGVFAELESQVVFLFQLIGDIEVYLASLGLRRLAAEAGFAVCLPELGDHGPRALSGLFNPWLVAEGRACTPADVILGDGEHLVFITGPNSGGKTRLLQALCLSQLLGQAGLFAPAARAELRWANGLFASLIEHVQIDPVEGRLGTELLRIRRAFERLRSGSMVVLDELCSGTNPSEGEALMQLVLDSLYELRPQAFITTHFLEFAAQLAASTRRHRFLQAELDAEQTPTFRFVEGVAKTSLAHRVAERLGVTPRSLRELILKNNPELIS